MSGKPVQIIKFEKDENYRRFKDVIHSYFVFVDGTELATHLTDYLRRELGKGAQWTERNNTLLYLEELHRSVKQSGSYPLLVGSHCLSNGVVSTEDVCLGNVEVEVAPKTVTWKIHIMGWVTREAS